MMQRQPSSRAPRTEKVTDLPAEKVREVVEDYMSIGARDIQQIAQPDGKWTVIAVIPESSLERFSS